MIRSRIKRWESSAPTVCLLGGSVVGKCLPGESWEKRAGGRNVFVREEQTARTKFLLKEQKEAISS